jgi:glycosyltransferase involved in cell wall biosynthesis
MSIEIIQVVQEFSTAGGVETVAWELAHAFGRAKIKNTVVASAIGKAVGNGTTVERITPWLARIPTRGVLRHIGRAIVVPIFTFAATWTLRHRTNAVVLSHGDSLSGDILVVHAVNAESLAEKRRAGFWRWILNPTHLWVALRDHWMIKGLRYRMFVAVSPRVSTELQHHFSVPPERICVIPNGIDLTRFRLDPDAGRAIREEFGIPAEARLLLFASHEFRRKGLEHVIGAIEQLDADVWLLVVGSDNPAPYRKQLKAATDRVIFAGARYDMPACYSAADAFVLPTAYETFSLVCMEAMASSVPVFATPVGGIEDYLVDGVNGYQIAPDADDIGAKLKQAFDDPGLWERMRDGARATAQKYGWDSIGSQYLELMEQVQRAKR